MEKISENKDSKDIQFLRQEQERLQTRLDTLQKEYKEKIYDIPASERDWYDKEIVDTDYKIRVLIPEKIRQLENTSSSQESSIEATPDQKVTEESKNLESDTTEKIKGVTKLPELFNMLKEMKGVQGSSEYYSFDELWSRIRAYINGETSETAITQSFGIREKVMELKEEREKAQEQKIESLRESIINDLEHIPKKDEPILRQKEFDPETYEW